MKRSLLLTLLVLAAVALVDFTADAQIIAGNNYLGFYLDSYGRVRTGLYPYVSAAREIDRLYPVAARDEHTAYDYYDNSENVWGPIPDTVPGVDSAYSTMANGSYDPPIQMPLFRVQTTILSWLDVPYIIVRYRFYNDSTAALNFYLGALVIPRVGGAYGGETVTYDPASNTTYFYREGEPSYWSERLVSKPTYSVKIWDWNWYSPDPNNDAATDSTRYLMAATPGFDSTLTVGPDGSIFNVNGGMVTLASGDSSELFYAIGFGTTSAEAIAACDSGEAKYKSIATSVKQEAYTLPARTSLLQNYPNPFNPATQIRFEIAKAGFTTLKVYNVVGQEIATLVQQQMEPGVYTSSFSGQNLPSGMYYYRLETGGYSSTMKMLLVK